LKTINPTKLSFLIRVLHEIYMDYGDLDVKVFDPVKNRALDAVVTLEDPNDPYQDYNVVFLDKKSLLKLPFEEQR
jgi:hypothetical protein